MSLCVTAGAAVTVHALTAFTLAWTHSVERTAWQEDWRITQAGLELVEARVLGSGAGMEPPPEARFDGRWWRWQPALAPLPELTLATSGATGGGWSLCAAGRCAPLAAEDGTPVTLTPCG
jgi:hypothetical protein